MPTTPEYGWDTPADTDYVTNGALSIRTLGDDIDATVYSIETTLTADKVAKAGDTMTGALIVPNVAASGRAIAIIQDGSNNAILQILNNAGAVQQGYILVAADNTMQLGLTGSTNNLTIDSSGNTSRLHAGETRPLPFAMEVGRVTVGANSDTTISFDSGRFTDQPIVTITGVSTASTVTTGHISTVSTSSFKLYNTTASSREFFWHAIQMTFADSEG
jgi:hypothetical protein